MIRRLPFILPLTFLSLAILLVILYFSPLEQATKSCGDGFIPLCFGLFSGILLLLYLPFGLYITLLIQNTFEFDQTISLYYASIPTLIIYLIIFFFVGKAIKMLFERINRKTKNLR